MNQTKTKGSGTFRALTTKDLAGFDQDARELILTAMNAGCTGRVSRKGHAILRNNTGQTASVSRHQTTQNRTAQNSQAEIRRLIDSHRSVLPRENRDTLPTGRMSVTRALESHGMTFSNWMNELTDGLPADGSVKVLHDASRGGYRFEVLEDPQIDSDQEQSVADERIPCPDCQETFRNRFALSGHQLAHSSPQITQLAALNHVSAQDVRDLLREAGTPMRDGKYDVTIERAESAGLVASYDCPVCDQGFAEASALQRHLTRTHRQPTISVVARLNHLTEKEVLDRLDTVVDRLPGGRPNRSPEALTAAGLRYPGDDQEETAAMVSGARTAQDKPTQSPQPAQDAETTTLDRIRALLGPDPRIAELEAEVARQKKRADSLETQLDQIKDALST